MIGNAAMHKPFGIENGLGCAAQAVLICGYYIVRQKFLQAKRASFPHRQWTLWKSKKKTKKKQKQIRKRKQTVAATATTTTTVTATAKEAQQQQQ